MTAGNEARRSEYPGATTRPIRRALRRGFDRIDRAADLAFGPQWNPLAQLGALGWFLFWIVAATGGYLFIFFDTGVVNAYASVEWLSNDHWFHAGIARSLHRYASDLMVAVMLVHLVREFCQDRYRGVRWFSWVTGVPLIWFVYISGITGYWLVWDKLAQYVAVTTSELLDWLPIFGEPISRNFLAPDYLSGRFFTLMVFLHIAVPLILLAVMWIHVQRITRARLTPSRPLLLMVLGGLLVASLVLPARTQGGAADLATVPTEIGIDWFFLPLYPLIQYVPNGVIWAGVGLFTVLLMAMPWLPRRRGRRPAEVFLDHCNGCARCVEDCPYAAVELVARTDGAPFPHEVKVNPDRCVACGICMGACPSSTPFRRSGALVTGIDLPDLPLADLREQVIEAAGRLDGPDRVMTLTCVQGAAGDLPGAVQMPCIAMIPPSLVDFILSRGHADGVVVAGCGEGRCHHRLGDEWTRQRFAHERDPYLRARVPRDRVLTIWAGSSERTRVVREHDAFREQLTALSEPKDVEPTSAKGDVLEEAGT